MHRTLAVVKGSRSAGDNGPERRHEVQRGPHPCRWPPSVLRPTDDCMCIGCSPISVFFSLSMPVTVRTRLLVRSASNPPAAALSAASYPALMTWLLERSARHSPARSVQNASNTAPVEPLTRRFTSAASPPAQDVKVGRVGDRAGAGGRGSRPGSAGGRPGDAAVLWAARRWHTDSATANENVGRDARPTKVA